MLIALSLLGVGTILAASAALFGVVKWAGVLYMAWLGWVQIRDARRPRPIGSPNTERGDSLSSARAGFLVGVLNPKAIVGDLGTGASRRHCQARAARGLAGPRAQSGSHASCASSSSSTIAQI